MIARRRLLTALGSTLALAICPVQTMARERDSRPNVLLIVADDVGYTDLGAYGSEIPTPNLDRLAAKGVKFSDFHTGMTCSPTRSMLLTGVDHHLAGLGNMAEDLAPNQKGRPGYEGHLNFSVAPLPAIFRAHGYRTVMAGKWHLGLTQETGPAARGFDRSFSSLQGGAGHFANMLPLVGPGKALYSEDGKPVEQLPGDFYSTRTFTDRLIGYLREGEADSARRPFFAYLAFTAPHFPIQAPPHSIDRFRGRYDAGYDALFERRLAAAKHMGIVPRDAKGAPRGPPGRAWDSLTATDRAMQSRRMEAFAAMVSDLDAQVGRVIDHLRRTGELDNTIVLFLSDNGYEGHDLRHGFPEAAEWADRCCDNGLENIGRPNSYVWMGPDWARASTAPFRIYKGFPTEGGTRVPFIVSWPGLKRHGIARARGHVADIAPTLLQIAGIEAPRGSFDGHAIHPMTGRSMLPFLTGGSDAVHPANEPFAQELFGKRAIRIGSLKAVNIVPPFGNGQWQLFDLSTDLAEIRDLAADRPDDLARLVVAWNDWAKRTNVILPDWTSGY